jgi:serine/threonine-protein kinase
MPRSADRNLLFGLLALQNNFIDRDGLLDAFQRWVNDRSTPLDRILLDRGALSPSQHLLLTGLIAEHIKLHGDDPEKSLAALSSIGSVRQDLSRLADPELHASLAQVSAAREDGDGDDPFRTVTASLGASTSVGSRFRILRPHAKGGLGQVSVALDRELDRPIALKEIQDRHADDPASRARFVQEAEITGKLEHPGIIPVYGLGHDASGRPFYAMRFIEGDSLGEAIAAFHTDEALKKDPDRRGARLRELLRRFTDVCNAVAYAHSRGVLHRDLKPGNIMLGPYGETLLVDWGLAKPLGSALAGESAGGAASGPGSSITGGPIRLSDPSGSRSDTVAGAPIGTPAYASPEQVVGALDRLGPATDIYGLGATLYTLLTGHAPVEAEDQWEVLHRVQRGAIPPPGSIDATIPRPLEAICLKAMAMKPEDRYASARALAEDVTHWLDDEPVSAHREPFAARAGRWMRRHRTLVTSTAAVLVLGVIGLAGFATVLAGTNRELERQRQRAEQREALAIDAVKKFRDAVTANPELKNNPGLEGLRKALLQEPLEFFRKLRDRLHADRDTRPAALAKLASANYVLAHTTAEIGSVTDAIRSYSESITLLERLARDHPAVPQVQSDLAGSYNNIGILLSATGHPTEALESYRRAVAIEKRLARDNPSVAEYQNDLARSYINIGNLLRPTGPQAEALESYLRALAIRERLARDNPTVAEYQRDLAMSHGNIGGLLSDSSQLAEALESHRRALAIREWLAQDHPTVSEYQSGLADSHYNIGVVLSSTGNLAEALESHQRAVVIRERLAHDYPTVSEYQGDLAMSHGHIGVLLRVAGHPDEALEEFRRALAVFQRLAHDNPAVTEYQRDLAQGHVDVGDLLHATGHLAEAVESYQRSLEIREQLAREHPSIPYDQSRLGATLNNLATLEMGQGRWREAQQRLERAIEHQRKALAAMPHHPEYRRFLKNHLGNLWTVHQTLKQPTEAVRAAREWVTLVRGNSADLYKAACALSLTVPLTRGEQRQAIAAEAVQTLRAAVTAGWSKAQHTSRDPDVAPLRDRDDFRRLLAELFDRGFPADPFAP